NTQAAVNFQNTKKIFFELKTAAQEIRFERLAEELPALTAEGFHGKISGENFIKGNFEPDSEQLVAEASFSFSIPDGTIRGAPVGKIETTGGMSYAGNNLTIKNLFIAYNDLTLLANGSVVTVRRNPLAQIEIRGKLPLDILPLLPLRMPDTFALPKISGVCDLAGAAKIHLSGTPPPELNGTINAPQLTVGSLPVAAVKIDFSHKNNALMLKSSGKLAAGAFQCEASADFIPKIFTYKSRIKAAELDLRRLLTELNSPYAPTCQGSLTLDGGFDGRGWDKHAVNGQINLSLNKGSLSGFALLRQLDTLLQTKIFQEFPVTTAAGVFKINQARVETNNLQIIGPETALLFQGTIWFDQRFENARLTVEISANSASKISAAVLDKMFLPLNTTYMQVFPLQGTLLDPSVEPAAQSTQTQPSAEPGFFQSLFKPQ
ncbi:MAG: AsmA-like C-terminal region-containing protein, partial [Candidatus Omnitrophica bacterium]|nr:AsmA-like C-terminal region-containing protein [Candidatus Omnitrophota bacterium]